MDALKIALETILVGALAVPWLVLGLHLFFPDTMDWLKQNIPAGDNSLQYAVAAVLAVSLAYSVGAAVSRLAQDFYNDDDFEVPLPPEDSIRASVYCDPADQPLMFDAGVALPAPNNNVTMASLCQDRRTSRGKARDEVIQRIQQVFQLQQDTLLLMGEPQTSQIRHLHQQLVVLQGAGFDGLLAFMLCLLAWNAEKAWSKYRRLLIPGGLFIYVLVVATLWNHFEMRRISHTIRLVQRWTPNDPPFMEGTALMLALAGCYLVLRKPRTRDDDSPEQRSGAGNRAPISYGGGAIVALALTGLAYSGWYWTEILYDRLVIYSYYASQHLLVKPPS